MGCRRERFRCRSSRKLFFGLLLLSLAVLTLLVHRLHFSSSPTTTLARISAQARADHARHPPRSPPIGRDHKAARAAHAPRGGSSISRGHNATHTAHGRHGSSIGRGGHNATTASVSSRMSTSKRGKTKTPRSASQRTQSHATVNNSVQASLEHRQRVLCVEFKCRLGNHLFLYASVLGLARRLHRIPVFLGPYHILRHALQYPPQPPSEELLGRCNKSRVIKEKECCRFNNFLLDMDPKADYTVRKYLQSWKYFEGAEAEVRKATMFRDDVRQRANRTIEALRGKCNRTLIGVHVRRGDYLKEKNLQIGRRTPPPDYYRKAMTYMRQRFGNVTFLLSVDNGTWFQESVTLASDVIVLKRQNPAVDMALLASLDHVITSVGTFSWWVGYLNKGVTVYWKDFIAHGTPFGNAFDHNGTTFIYPGWIPL